MASEVKSIRERRDEWLFHYTPLRTAVEHILPTCQMRMNPFTRMRDPREYSAWRPAVAGFPGEATKEEIQRGWVEATRKLTDLQSRFKLLSFTQDDPATEGEYGRGYARSRLWEAYGDVGRGVCLVLDKAAAIEEIVPQLQALGQTHHGPVQYWNQALGREIQLDLNSAMEGRADENINAKVGRFAEALFLTKNTEWSSETEYRFVVRTGDDLAVTVDVTACLRAVILGPETSNHYLPAIRDLCRPQGLAIGKLIWWNNRPMLVDKPEEQ